MRHWVKLWVKILDDVKLAAMPDDLFRFSVNLMAIGGRVDRDGELGTVEEIAFWLRLGNDVTARYLSELEKQRVTCNKKGVWSLQNWKDYQSRAPSSKRDAVRERVQKHRENKANSPAPENGRNDVTSSLPVDGNDTRTEQIQIQIQNKDLGADAPPDSPPKADKPPRKDKPPKAARSELMDHPAVIAYRDRMLVTPGLAARRAMAERVTDIELWVKVMGQWLVNKYNPANVAGLMDAYAKGGLNGHDGKSSADQRQSSGPAGAHVGGQSAAARSGGLAATFGRAKGTD